MTWDQFGNLGLTTAQKNVLATFAAIAINKPAEDMMDFSGVTFDQAKKIINFETDLRALVEPAFRAANAMRRKVIREAGKAADDATPGGSL